MPPEEAFPVFESLSEKQRETLALASRHLTSKEIAQRLGVAPVTIDKRIESVRARCGNVARPELVRLFSQWSTTYDQTIYDPIIVDSFADLRPSSGSQQDDVSLEFHDSMAFDARALWDRGPVTLRPGLNPADLGVAGKLIIIFGGAVAVMMVAVLCMAFADALMRFLAR